jgi:sec-independent protein translocase protein TatC
MRVFPKLRRRSPEERSGTMTLVEHLEELRHRLIVSMIAITFGAIVGWFLFGPVVNLLLHPFCDYVHSLPKAHRPIGGCQLAYFGVLEPMIIKLKIVLYVGVLVALPVLLYQLWMFIVPGLTSRERRMAVPFVASSVLLFALGASFAYFTLPRGLNFLLGFAGSKFAPILQGSQFVTFVLLVALAFGISFEFPILLNFLELVGVLSTATLRKYRRFAILGISIFAAVITPSSDPYTMLAMTIPMCLFYEAAIIVGRLLKR